MKNLSLILAMSSLSMLASCRGSDDDDDSPLPPNYSQQLEGTYEVFDSPLSNCGDKITFNDANYTWERICTTATNVQSQYEEGAYVATTNKLNFIASRTSCEGSTLRNSTYDYDLSDSEDSLNIRAERNLTFPRINSSESATNGRSVVYGCFNSAGDFESNETFSRLY